ncbi:MAG: hypothetical protein ACPGYV_12045, partial [Phycisphaeraceae bacterium]
MITKASTSSEAIFAPIDDLLALSLPRSGSTDAAIQTFVGSHELLAFLREMTDVPVYSGRLADAFKERDALSGLSSCRQLRSALGMKLGVFLQHVSTLAAALDAA